MSLYNLKTDLFNLINNIDFETGEVDESTLSKIFDIEKSIEEKAISMAYVVEEFKSELEAVSEALKRMASRKLSIAKKISSLEMCLKSTMIEMGKDEIRTSPHFVIKIKNNPPSVNVFNVNDLPSDYVEETVLYKADKKKIKEAIKSGVEVKGAELVSSQRVEIK